MKRDPLVIIVSAPSGSGKTTIVDSMLKSMDGIEQTVSYTTRLPRNGERDGQDYIFVSEEDFRKRIEEGDFLEWEENFGNLYGTSEEQVRKTLARGADIILSIDVKGARNVKNRFPESISIFIMPPSEEELARRLRNRRTDDDRQVVIRLKEAAREIKASEEYDYLLINDDLERAVDELKGIIEQERLRKMAHAKNKGE
ncbi:MAG: guanylate kinase [Candidatus Omnitrophica bacterium]|nr:guanylate kinase [Candidatus Omnitrophota bacterium]